VRQFLRIYVCVIGLCVGGCGGAFFVDGTLGERQRERDRAAHPDQFECGGAGVDVYLAGGFLLGAVPSAWLLVRFGALDWIKSAANAKPAGRKPA
jgi:hypothetical protein